MANANKTAFLMNRASIQPAGYGAGGGDTGWDARPDINTFWKLLTGSAVTAGLRKGTVILSAIVVPSEVAAPAAGTASIVNTTGSATILSGLDLTTANIYELESPTRLTVNSYFTFTPTSQTASTGVWVGLRVILPPNKP